MPLRHRDSFPPPRVLTRLGVGREGRPFVPSRPPEVVDLEEPPVGGRTGGRGQGAGSPRDRSPSLRPRPRLLELPETVRSARTTPSVTALAAVVVALLLVAAVFGARVWWLGRPGQAAASTAAPGLVRGSTTLTPGAPAPTSAPAAVPTGSTAPAGAPSPAVSTAPSAGAVVVHVVGRVKRPGMVRLQPGARVADAVAASGGPATGADLAAINLARPVVDGEQIRVPRPGEQATVAGPTGPVPGGASQGPGVTGGGGGGQVSINTADLATLDTLPGVGPVLAQRIIDWRTEHGRFTSVDELGEVSGIGEKLLARLRPKVTV